MNKYHLEGLLYSTFSKDVDIPNSTDERLQRIYAELPDLPDMDTADKVSGRKIGRRTFILLAAAILAAAVFAGSVLAYSLADLEFYRSIFGKSVSGNENDRTYYTAEGYEAQYPLNERADVSEDEAHSTIGQYVRLVDKQLEIDGVVFTVNNFVIDENGIGYITYTIDRQAGLNGFLDIYSDMYVGFRGQPRITSRGSIINSRSLLSSEGRTQSSAYIVEVFCINEPLTAASDITLNFPDVTNGEIISIKMPIDILVPTIGFAALDGRHIARVSALGMALECIDHDEGSCDIKEIVIVSGADRYIVESQKQNILNTVCAVAWGVSVAYDMPQPPQYNTQSCAFNRLVVPSEITQIILNDTACLPTEE